MQMCVGWVAQRPSGRLKLFGMERAVEKASATSPTPRYKTITAKPSDGSVVLAALRPSVTDIFNLIVSLSRRESSRYDVVTAPKRWGPLGLFLADLMDEIRVSLFHTLSQVDRPKVSPADME